MKFLLVEDELGIRDEIVNNLMHSRGDACDWAGNQRDALDKVKSGHFDLVILDLQIPAVPGSRAVVDYGKHTLREIRELRGNDVAVLLMTAYHSDCVDMLDELQDLGIDGSLSKQKPLSARALNAAIDKTLARFRHRRKPRKVAADQPLKPFEGGVLAFYPRHIDLLGEAIAWASRRGQAFPALRFLRARNRLGHYINIANKVLAARLHPNLSPNTLSRAIVDLRLRISETMSDRLGLDCGKQDVIATGGHGYFLQDWIIVENHDDAAQASPETPAPIGRATTARPGSTPASGGSLSS